MFSLLNKTPAIALTLLLGLVVCALAQERGGEEQDPADPLAKKIHVDLPQDGIDDPMPGLLALPRSLPGPSGKQLVRAIVLGGHCTKPEDLSVRYSYVLPKKDRVAGKGAWGVEATVFPRAGAAHAELHSLLRPERSAGPTLPWTDVFERIALPGLFFRTSRENGIVICYGVVRHVFVYVGCNAPRSGVEQEDMRAWTEARRREAVDVLHQLIEAIRRAGSAERPVTGSSVASVTLEKGDGKPPLGILSILPGDKVDDEQLLRFWVFFGTGRKVCGGKASSLRARPAARLKLPAEFWSSKREITVYRVIEGDLFRVEKIELTVKPGERKATWEAKSRAKDSR